MNPRRRPARRGFTLFEMTLLISSLAIVIGLCGGLLHSLLRLENAGRESVNEMTTLNRLARQFRQDVRASLTGKATSDSLALERPGGPQFSYSLKGVELRREEKEGDRLIRHETYNVRHLGPVRFSVDSSIVELTLTHHKPDHAALKRPSVVIAAYLGKDLDVTEKKGAKE